MLPENKSKEKLVLLIGFLLIAVVALVTFLRPSFRGSETKDFSAGSQTVKEYPKISAKELAEKLRNKENVAIIDTRSSDDYQIEHIIDSISAPFEELNEKEIDVPIDAAIVIVGSGSEQSDQAAEVMEIKGFPNLLVLSGGLTAWKNNNGQTVSWGDPTSFINQSKVTFISLEDTKKVLDEKRPVYILDVRPPDSFSPHLPGAVNIPFEELEKRRNKIPSGREIVVYGATELEGFQAGVRLYDLNVFSALVLRGGFASWQEKGFPIEK